MATVTVLGAGMMGTALCTPIADAGHSIRLVGTHLDNAIIESMKQHRRHPKLGVDLPPSVTPYSIEELEVAMQGSELLALGVSSAGVLWAAEKIAPFLKPGAAILSVTKGLAEISPGNLGVLPDVLRGALPESLRDTVFPAAIGGPCIAGELARRVPTGVVFAGRDASVLERFASAFATPYYHIRTSTDVVGVEVCAALKNAYAMAVGIGVGVHERAGGSPAPVAHHNYEAAIFAQSCIEMDILVRALHGDPKQVPGLSGAGDLFVTCSGGRSSRLGRLLGMGFSMEESRARMAGDTLESAELVEILGSSIPRLEEAGKIKTGALPLMEHLYEIIVQGKPMNMPFDLFF